MAFIVHAFECPCFGFTKTVTHRKKFKRGPVQGWPAREAVLTWDSVEKHLPGGEGLGDVLRGKGLEYSHSTAKVGSIGKQGMTNDLFSKQLLKEITMANSKSSLMS